MKFYFMEETDIRYETNKHKKIYEIQFMISDLNT